MGKTKIIGALLILIFSATFASAESYYVGQVIGGLDGTGQYSGDRLSVKILGIVSSGPYAETYSLRVALYDEAGQTIGQAVVEPGTDLRDIFFDGEGNFALSSSLVINEINLNVSETPKPGAGQETGQPDETINDQNINDENVDGQATGQEGEIPVQGPEGNAEPQYCEDGIHKIWESWDIECNTCSCGNDGTISCTEIDCSAQNSDLNDAAQNEVGQPAGTGIIESIMQFFQGLLKMIFV